MLLYMTGKNPCKKRKQPVTRTQSCMMAIPKTVATRNIHNNPQIKLRERARSDLGYNSSYSLRGQ